MTEPEAAQDAQDDVTLALVSRIVVLEELVNWLSLVYGDNEPIFAGADGHGTGPGGIPLGSAAQMHTLWHQVIGREHQSEPPGEMQQCQHCGRWSVNNA